MGIWGWLRHGNRAKIQASYKAASKPQLMVRSTLHTYVYLDLKASTKSLCNNLFCPMSGPTGECLGLLSPLHTPHHVPSWRVQLLYDIASNWEKAAKLARWWIWHHGSDKTSKHLSSVLATMKESHCRQVSQFVPEEAAAFSVAEVEDGQGNLQEQLQEQR